MEDRTRSQLRNMVQEARALLLEEARQQLEGIYGIHTDGRRESVDNLPEVQKDPDRQQTLLDILHFLDMEQQAGLPPAEAVTRLANEVAFTHLNRFVALKMMEARKLIKQTVSRGLQSNAFLLYVVEVLGKFSLAEVGDVDRAYRDFILHQCRQIAAEIRVLFDPDNLPSRLFPRPRALNRLLELLNDESLADAWQQEESIGWLYQYFIEEDKDAVFEKIYRHKQKMDLRDIPKATQIFTPRWIVQYLVENTLGRLWLRMHPDSRLREKMKYYVPNPYTDNQRLPVKSVREITLLDPACGTMHFGLVAFDLFYKMYLEELENAGKPGWPEPPETGDGRPEAWIPVAIVENNLYGIDIDLRSVQLAALALYLKAKSYHRGCRITKLNLVYTDIPPLQPETIQSFLERISPKYDITRKLLAEIFPQLAKAYYLGSLLKIEELVSDFLAREKKALYREYKQSSLFLEPEQRRLTFYGELSWQEVKEEVFALLNTFFEQENGFMQKAIAGEAIQGIGLIDALMKKYDVVVTNPPYAGRRNVGVYLAEELKRHYSISATDLYACFIQRNVELTGPFGFVGMITQQSFMFISSFQKLREYVMQECVVETMAHTGPRAFDEIAGEKVNTTAFVLRREPETPRRLAHKGVYFRLVRAPDGDSKRRAFEQALGAWRAKREDGS